MPTDWTRLAKAKQFTVEGDEVVVELAGERRHRVKVFEEGAQLRLRGIIATPSRIGDLDQETRRAWEHNRGDSLVGFRIDHRGRLVGECLVPVAGISAEEFVACVRAVAAACDRQEYLLTGKDVF